jgi:signal transduction histidine kinase
LAPAEDRTAKALDLLHDEIGPLLSAAGLKLQLVSMDHPETAEQVREVTAALDEAIDLIRGLSRKLMPGADRGIKFDSRKR